MSQRKEEIVTSKRFSKFFDYTVFCCYLYFILSFLSREIIGLEEMDKGDNTN